MKKYFFTGFVLLLPFALTMVVIVFVINILTKPFLGFVESLLHYFNFHYNIFPFIESPQMLQLFSKLLILLFLFTLILLIGFIGRLVIFNFFFHLSDRFMRRIPVINKIYKAVKDVVHIIFSAESAGFSRAVLVRYPHSGALCIGLVAGDDSEKGKNLLKDQLSIFVPGGLNPTYGFILIYQEDEVIPMDMSVEDAMKFVISCGIIANDFSVSRSQGSMPL